MMTIDTDLHNFGMPVAGPFPRGVRKRPRFMAYGSDAAIARGLIPVEDAGLDEIIAFDDLERSIKHCREQKIYPEFWQHATWGPPGFRSFQNGDPLCWGYSFVAAFMSRRAALDMDTILFSPVAMAGAIEWRNEGNYLSDAIDWARTEGVVPVEFVDNGDFNSRNRNWRTYKDGWKEARAQHKLDMAWDCYNGHDDKRRLCHLATILECACGGYSAWNHLGHAMEVVGLMWTPGTYLNVTIVIRNSHGETEYITMKGSLCVPNETIAIVSEAIAA